MKARVLGDVNHPRPTEQCAVCIDHGRTVDRSIAITLEQVEQCDDAEFARLHCERVGDRAWYQFGLRQRFRTGGALRIERLERKLRKSDDRSAVARRLLERP